jgi:exonuclease III
MSAIFRLLSWNLNGRRGTLPAQVAAILNRKPDFVCLQEVTRSTVAALRYELAAAGLVHIVDSFADSPSWIATGPRRYGLVIAAKYQSAMNHCPVPALWPERILTASINLASGTLLLTTVHIPPGRGNGIKKVEMLEALAATLDHESALPRVVCGDLNTPRDELASGEVVSWGQRLILGFPKVRKRVRGEDGVRWDTAERAILQHSRLSDAFRRLHGYDAQEFSWFVRRGNTVVGRRFDHAFCSPEVQPVGCRYLHDVRDERLSDHSALELEFSLRTPDSK